MGAFLIPKTEVVIMAKLTDKQRKKIIADRVNGTSIRALAKKYGVSTTTVQNVLKSDTELTQKCTQKKEQNTAEVLAYMDGRKNDVCALIDLFLAELRNKEKIEATPLHQIATTMGIVIDKFTANESAANTVRKENNLLEAIVKSAGEDIETDEIREIQQAAAPVADVVEQTEISGV